MGGGAEHRLIEIAKRLVAYGHQVTVICAKTASDLPLETEVDGVRVVFIKTVPDWLHSYQELAFFLSRYIYFVKIYFHIKLFRALKPDIIVDYAAPSVSLSYLVARRLNIPCCVEIMEYRTSSRWFKVAGIVTAVFGNVSNVFLHAFNYTSIISIGDFTTQQMLRAGFPEVNVNTVTMGIDVLKYSEVENSEHDPQQLVYLARMVPQKGHRYLLAAFALLVEDFPELNLLLIGDGVTRSSLNKQCLDLGISERVQFAGDLRGQEKLNLLSRAGLFVMPSIEEGFGLVLLEAMASGLPIVYFDLEVYRQFMRAECGIAVPIENEEALAKAIRKVIETPDLAEEMRTFNLEYVRNFNWDDIARLEESVLIEAISQA